MYTGPRGLDLLTASRSDIGSSGCGMDQVRTHPRSATRHIQTLLSVEELLLRPVLDLGGRTQHFWMTMGYAVNHMATGPFCVTANVLAGLA